MLSARSSLTDLHFMMDPVTVEPPNDLCVSVEEGLARVCRAWTSGQFLPLLEANFAGYLYHVLVSDRGGDARFVHLDTRLAHSKSQAKFDLVDGHVLTTENRRKAILGISEMSDDMRRFAASKGSLAF